MKFPPTVPRERKLRSREKSEYLQVTQEVRGMHSFKAYFDHSLWAGAALGPGDSAVSGERNTAASVIF